MGILITICVLLAVAAEAKGKRKGKGKGKTQKIKIEKNCDAGMPNQECGGNKLKTWYWNGSECEKITACKGRKNNNGNRFQKKKWCEKNCGAGIGNTINRQDKMARPAKQGKMARPAKQDKMARPGKQDKMARPATAQ